jgi:hypothetical protein
LSTIAGPQVPVIPLSDVVDNTGTVVPAHIVNVGTKPKVGVTLGLTVTVNVVETAHCPPFGVNVYTPEFWLSTIAGLHVPLIPLSDVFGKTGATELLQRVSDVPNANEGVTIGLTVTVNVTTVAHRPASGVKVYTAEF